MNTPKIFSHQSGPLKVIFRIFGIFRIFDSKISHTMIRDLVVHTCIRKKIIMFYRLSCISLLGRTIDWIELDWIMGSHQNLITHAIYMIMKVNVKVFFCISIDRNEWDNDWSEIWYRSDVIRLKIAVYQSFNQSKCVQKHSVMFYSYTNNISFLKIEFDPLITLVIKIIHDDNLCDVTPAQKQHTKSFQTLRSETFRFIKHPV